MLKMPSRSKHECALPDATLAEGMRWICPSCRRRWRLARQGDPPMRQSTWEQPLVRPPGVWQPDWR